MPKAVAKKKGMPAPAVDPAARKSREEDEHVVDLLDREIEAEVGHDIPTDNGSDVVRENTGRDGELSDFIRESREIEAHKREYIEKLEAATKKRIAALRKSKAIITNSANLTFDVRFKSLLTTFRVGLETGANGVSRKREKTAIDVKCVASPRTRESVSKAIDQRIAKVENDVLDKKRRHFDFLCKELGRREEAWVRARQQDMNLMQEYDDLHEKFKAVEKVDVADEEAEAFARYWVLRDLKLAKGKVLRYKDMGQELATGARQRQRKRVEAPDKASQASHSQLKVRDSRKRSDEDIAEEAAKSIARYCMDYRAATHTPPPGSYCASTSATTLDPRFVHEEQLMQTLWPQTLKTGTWKAIDYDIVEADKTPTLRDVFDRQGQVLLAVQEMQRVQHLHSLALASTFEAVANVRLSVARDRNQEEKLAKELKAVQRVAVLNSDPDLRSLPFRSVPEIFWFFAKQDRVEKLARYLLVYVQYTKNFALALNSTLIHPDLQSLAYWPGSLKGIRYSQTCPCTVYVNA